jgi:two-component system sensor histidine kinase KdpD
VPALFQRFVRLESPGMNRVPGLGLGLYLCRMLVEAHHGRIWVEEAPGGGAAFVVELPLGEASDVS